MKKIAILQSNYIPWCGYFDLINSVDEFILFDDVQYTKRDWRNRNMIKTPSGSSWLTIPVEVANKFNQKIKEVRIAEKGWGKQHMIILDHNYKKAPFYTETSEWLYPLLLYEYEFLIDATHTITKKIISVLDINTKITKSSDYILLDEKSEKLLGLCQQVKADIYVSGPAAKKYLNLEKFKQAKVGVEWFSYKRYDQYQQQWGGVISNLSIVDVFFNIGIKNTQELITCSSQS